MLTSNHYVGEAGVQYYAYQSRFGELSGRLIANKFANLIRPTDTVLDFGCGGGFALSALNCARRLGVEINPAARAAAERKGVECFETLDEVENEIVDVAIAHHSLEHVLAPLMTLNSLRFKLKPGGLLLLAVPIDDWRRQKRYDPTDINHHLYTWTPLLLGHLLNEAGFDTHTLSSRIGINGWFRAFPYCYGRIPQPCLDLLSKIWCAIRKTREINLSVRNPG